MKHLLSNILNGKDNRMSGVLALALVALIALGCTCGKNFDLSNIGSNSNSSGTSNTSSSDPFGGDDDDSGDVDDNLVKATIKSTTAMFANAISTEDFSRLYADTADEFKKQYTEEQLKAAFSDFIRQKRQLLPILAKTVAMDPEFDSPPATRTEGSHAILTAAGKYNTTPLPVRFKYEYVKRGCSWKLLKMEIYVR